MTTENNKITDNEILNTFTCENNIDILQNVFTRYGLKEYFVQFCLKFKNKNQLNKLHLPYVAILYEGGYHQRISEHDMRLLLLYGLFDNSTMDFNKIHNSVKKTKQVTDVFYEEIVLLISKNKFSTKHNLYSIVKDSKIMYFYFNDNILKEIQDMLRKYTLMKENVYFYEVDKNDFYLNMYTTKVFNSIRANKWLTQWGKIKAFKRNWHEVIKKAEALYIKGITIT